MLVEWNDSKENEKLHGRDTLVVIALDPHSGSCEYKFTGARRTDKRYLWVINMPVSQENLPDVWIAFRNVNETEMSDSRYLG